MKSYLLIPILFLEINIMGKIKMDVPVIPYPQEVTLSESYFAINKDINIYSNSNRLNNSINQIQKNIKELFATEARLSDEESACIILKLNPDFKASLIPNDKIDESYRLSINEERILIEAATPRAIFYGAMSLIQLLDKTTSNKIQCMEIIDWPDLKIRGVSDDISRGQVSTLNNFKRIIEFIARYKMNTYMPYIEDVLQLDAYPTIGKNRGALSKSEVQELIAFAAEHYVEIIPIFQTLGHYENILNQDEFVEYAEFHGAASLCVAEEKTYEFLENMLEEVFELFPSKYFHMGADESYDVGLGKSKHLVEQSSLAEVHAKHYQRVYDICKKHGKEVMMYGDIILGHPEILSMLPKDITIVDWHYRPEFEYASTIIFEEAGFDYIVSPSVWNYTSTFPVYSNAIPNIKYITGSGIKNNAVGMINSNWGDYGAETLKELILYGYAYSAQCAWNFEESNIGEFNTIFFHDFFGVQDYRLIKIYETFSNLYNQVVWHEVWRHPLLEYRESAWWESRTMPAVDYEQMNSMLYDVGSNLDELKKIVKRNQDHLEIISFLLELNKWYQKKLLTQFYLRHAHDLQNLKIKNDESIPDVTNRIKLIEKLLGGIDLKKMVFANISSLEQIKTGYKNLWLNYYRPENLWMIEDKFDRLIQYFAEIEKGLSESNLTSPKIESEWIYCSRDGDQFYSKVKFQKKFSIDAEIASAKLQLLGDTFAKLYINDRYVAQVYARRSGSLLVDYKRIKFLDISKYFRDGENKIEVIVENYNHNPSAGFNLISQILTSNGELKIISDDSWEALPLEVENAAWQKAVSKEYRFIVTQPNFKTNRTSWIER